MPTQSIKRFIAGAVCAKCQQKDRTVVYDDAHWLYSECVACSFKQQQPKEDAPQADLSAEEKA